jgi:hypothetical protein
VSWNRQTVAAALVETLTVATAAEVPPPSVFGAAPLTLNPPAIVIGRPTGRYGDWAFAVDEMALPVVVVGAAFDDDALDALAEVVRQAVLVDPTLGGAVKSVYPAERRNPRNVSVAGIDVQTTEVVLTVVM